ncbi:fanconi anemia group D2 protein [Trichonephila inaurata madagascariensis]|uniref:Fanconi anemia group D2 protein n=1 Tax=Trichonephila inaurata madagascariensis TaxID=2747483 RepID=A0A8X6YZ73_9ARAC|nr:fanconi anemia group D2 protein [Trichonephila inaurata madagascariensis]
MSLERVGKKFSDVFLSQEPALNHKRFGRNPENTFENILKRVGYIVGEKNNANELDVDQAVFLRDLSKLLTDKNPSIIQNFSKGFEEHLEDEIRLKWSLMPTVTTTTCETARNVSQDSLVHLLLSIEVIQEKIISVMLAKLVEFSYCENTALYDRSEGKTVACLIISQFRWLNKLINSEALAEKLLEIIEATPKEVQRDIIKLLPDVINEFDHPKVAKRLGEIFLDNQELNVIILDTLTNLNIEPELLSNMREKVTDTITTANIEDLPVLVKFVLQDLSQIDAPQTIRNLRQKLDFDSTFNPIISSTPLESKDKDISKSIEDCVLNTIRHALKFQKPLCDAWIKQIEVLQGPLNHKSLDIFVVLMLMSLGINEKKLESLIKNKIRTCDINEDLLQIAFRCHCSVLQEYAHELLKLAESLLRCIEPIISNFGCSIYIKCFIWFDSFYKQEVIGNLITHVGNRLENEINTALNTLLSLIRSHTEKMVSYAIFVKNLLDHLHEMTLNQIRKVHEMLSILAYQGGREGSMLLDDMLIIIRKQLTNKNLQYRKMGVIGALMAAKIAAEKESDDTLDASITSGALDLDECFQHSIKLLELVTESTSGSCEAFALFCDELSHIMLEKKLSQPILDWIGEHVLSDFEETYIVDIKPDEYSGKNYCPKFGLDEVNEPIAIDLYCIVLKDTEKNKLKLNLNNSRPEIKSKSKLDQSRVLKTLLKISQVPENSDSNSTADKIGSPLKLAPMFRLLRIFRQIHDNNLDAIDALLGCSITLPEIKFQKFGILSMSEKHLILNVLFFCINWIRENINAFASTTDEDIRCNVLSRLQLLIELEGLVCKYMGEVTDYTPPLANFDCDEKSLNVFKKPSKKPVKRTIKNKKGKAKKCKMDESNEQTDTLSHDASSKSKSSDSEEEFEANGELDAKTIKSLQPFFRELDLEVFVLLKSEITFKKRSDIFANEKVTSAQLHPTELKFLLDDLTSKLHYSIGSFVTYFRGSQKQAGFSNLESHSSVKIIMFCIQLIPALCKIVDEFIKFFKNLKIDSDGIEDSLVIYSAETQNVIKCLNLALKVMRQIMSWKNFNLTDNAVLLKKAIAAFVPDKEIKDSNDKSLRLCVQYLIEIAENIPSLSCAANLIQLLVSILSYTEDSECKIKVSTVALNFLKKKWFDFDTKITKSAEINENVKCILEAYLKNSISVLKALDFLSVEAFPQLLDTESGTEFCTLNKSTFSIFYKVMLNNLAGHVKFYFATKHNVEEQMFEWSVAFKVFQVFTNLLKHFGSRSHIGACLKSSREILQTFLRYGMPLMDKLFVERKEEVICLMKILQVSTRYLQHVCCHSKVLKDVTLINHVPPLKKSLEVFVFRVKMMLAVNKCEEAFWIGNLKNRDLKGEEILSQAMQEENEDFNSDVGEEEQAKSDTDLSNIESDA